ncbi:unnamed protein product [Parnassius apollo]|uniref:(apollo) hypothetical protein n=1 Tax=Parnassius apollo TaxID=110799 RepID=A0A8S3XY79_PARAO|nr:unnamed protein product [Parnassius apollo]
MEAEETMRCNTEPQLFPGNRSLPDLPLITLQNIPLQTVMAPIDVVQPNVEEEFEVSCYLNSIVRKTTNNIVEVAQGIKAEKFAWFIGVLGLFPYGINGLQQPRPVTITPLDYFQVRMLGDDRRFQRNDYLFYALSLFEYYRVKSTISACGNKIRNQEGYIEDVHLYIKNLKEYDAYRRAAALNDLLAQTRTLGPPTYFLTFSSNDLN